MNSLSKFLLTIIATILIAHIDSFSLKPRISKVKSDSKSLEILFDLPLFEIDNKLNFESLISNTRLYKFVNQYALVYEIIISVPSPDGFKLSKYTINKTTTIPINQINIKNLENTNPIVVDRKLDDNLVLIEYQGIAGLRHIAKIKIIAAFVSSDLSNVIITNKAFVNVDFYANNSNHIAALNNEPIAVAINHYDTPSFRIKTTTSKKLDIPKIQSQNQQVIKIDIQEEGIYRIDAAQITALGVNVNSIDAETIKIYGNGGKPLSEIVSDGPNSMPVEQNIIVRKKPDNTLDYILFYGNGTTGFEFRNGGIRRYRNPYSNTNSYFLTWGGTKGARATELEPPVGEVKHKPTTYYHRIFREEELSNPYTKASGRSWFGTSLFPVTLTDVLHNLDRNQEIFARFALAHRSDRYGKFLIYQGNEKIYEQVISSVALRGYEHAKREIYNVTLDSKLIPVDNRSVFKINYSNIDAPTTSIPFLDYYEIHYPRSFFAIDNELSFIADTALKDITEYSINGFSGEIIGFDVSNFRKPQLLKNLSNTNGLFIFRTKNDDYQLHKYYISGKTKKANLTLINYENILNDINFDILLITDKTLVNSAHKYKEYRESKGDHKVKVVTTEQIYNTMNAGTPDLAAIRNFVQYIHSHSLLKAVILWGDGHFDYRGVQYKQPNPVPAYQTPDEDEYSYSEIDRSYSTDDFYVWVSGDDYLPDLTIGRLPFNTDAEGNWIVEKIKKYEQGSANDDWRTRILLMADDGIGEYYDRADHVNYSERLFREHIPDHFITDRVYLVEYPTENIPGGRRKPSCTQAMLSTLNNKGALVWNYIGHGNPRVLSHEEVFNRDVHIGQMTNIDRLTFMTAATCDFGRFDDPEIKSGSEELILSKSGGAIGVYSATRVVMGSFNAELNDFLFDKLLFPDPETKQYYTFGEASLLVKMVYNRINDQKYVLFGDPTSKLLIPQKFIKITKINDKDLDDTSSNYLKLKGLSTVKIQGEIFDPTTNQIDSDFNGNIWLTMFDGEQLIQTYDNTPYSALYKFQKMGPALNRTTTKIHQGRFEASFIIPMDISFSDSLGRLYSFAISDKNEYAKGVTRKFKIDGIEITDVKDNTPPEVYLYIDSREFKSGDIVSQNPLLIADLYDGSGINSTGLGIGHLTEVWIDNNPNSIDLTKEIRNSFDKPNYSNIEKVLTGLNPGKHTLKFRTWDVFNNFTVKEIEFTIPNPNQQGIIRNALIKPNPFDARGATIRLNHNLVPPIQAKLLIYNSLGQLIQSLEKTYSQYSNLEIEWNCLDHSGKQVPIGTYYFQVQLSNNQGNSAISNAVIGMFIE